MANKKTTDKKVETKVVKTKIKITKPNGNVIIRDNYEGLKKQYESKNCKVEEV